MERKPAVADAFYTGDPVRLKKEVLSYIEKGVPDKAEGKVLGVLVPHAGYAYSGPVAGTGFAAVKELNFNTAVFLGAGHNCPSAGGALAAKGSFLTPLGKLEIDEKFTGSLLKKSAVFEDLSEAHAKEHSIEVQLPFLQALKGDSVKIVPVLFNTGELPVLREAGRVLGGEMKGKDAILFISSDLSHFPPSAVARPADTAALLALKMAMRLGDVSYFELASKILSAKGGRELSCVCCGQAAITAGAAACMELGANDFQILCYTNSGDISGENSRVVGYGAGLFIKADGKPETSLPVTSGMKKELLALARKSIAGYLKNGKELRLPLSGEPVFNLPGAVFVTLTEKGKLRGCIGTMEPQGTLLDAVASFAASSAFCDSRFSPLDASELDSVKIEISILSPLVKAAGHEEVEPGKHGVYIKRGGRSGTYLPQVWEHFRTKEEFLCSLCLEKTGLEADAWKKPSTGIFVYTVDAFKEE
ncbi:MAG: AmmeMemoRadiSam system protein B [bacterium]